MKFIICGASGYLGKNLIKRLVAENHHIIALSRTPGRQNANTTPGLNWKKWKNEDYSDWIDEINKDAVIINLIGEQIAAKRWTEKRKKELLESRVNSGKLILNAIKSAAEKPAVLLQASAIGIYTSAQGEDTSVDEQSATGGNFISDLVVQWENSTGEAESLGIKRFVLRTGLVIGKESELMKKFALPFKLFIGGPLGSGNQMMSWVHVDDFVESALYLINNNCESGAYNLTAPNPVTMKDFCKELGEYFKRPSWLPVPSIALKILFGQMAEQTMLTGEKVLPKALLESGYKFKYADLKSALKFI